ncbi:MAG: SEC-C domain-containing protein [Betaproteobacteria bacterium]|nr:SEC-C domain-containing protein [Betaproteobacteria bacterium]
MKVGRNDPCPCGSGKKYKHCCMGRDEEAAASPEDLHWRRLRRAIDSLPTDLLRFADAYFGHAGLLEAWDEFTLWQDVPFDAESPHIPVFMPWFYYNWKPDPVETQVNADARSELTAAEAYLRKKTRHLDPLVQRYIEACVAAPLSFYDVVTCEPARGFALRDIMTEEACRVTERSASRSVQPGDVLFAKIARLDDLAVMEACAPVVIPPDRKAPILELRKAIRESGTPPTPDVLRDYDIEFFELYHAIADALLNPQPPQMQNTDGEPLSFHKLVFEIQSPRAAFDALKDLALDLDDAELLSEARFDREGALRRVQFSWSKRGNPVNKSWDNTVLGNLSIDGARLTAEVNSGERAIRIREIVEERLGARAKHLATEIQSTESMLARAERQRGGKKARAAQAEHERLAALPEVQAMVKEHFRRHFESWVDQPIPALGGRTPREAMQDPDGREMVEALVQQAERHGRAMQPPMDESIIRDLRARLGL